MQLHEQYRPSDWPEVVGQDKAIAKINALRKRGLAGRAFWISGQSGTGKTTIARLLAMEIADEMNVEELDAGDLTTERLRDIDRTQWSGCLGKRWGGSTKGRRIKVTAEQTQTIVRLKDEGEKVAAIARATGLSRPTVYNVLAMSRV